MDRPLSVAVVGAGGWGATHVDNWTALEERGGVRLVAACDLNAATLAPLAARGVKCFGDVAEMLAAARPDAVSVAVGIGAHRAVAAAALKAGAAVLCEKPAAPTVADADAMIAARDAAHLPAFIAFQVIFTKEVREIKELILSGRYGKLLSAKAVGSSFRDDAYYARNSWAGMKRTPDGRPVYDSPFANAYAHYINLALFGAGAGLEDSARVTAVEGGLWKWRANIDNFDTCALTFQTAEGVPVSAKFSHAVTKQVPTVVTFELEAATVSWTYYGWRLLSKAGEVLREEKGDDPQRQMFRSFARHVRGAGLENLGCTLECAREHIRAVEMAQAALPVVPLATREEADALMARP